MGLGAMIYSYVPSLIKFRSRIQKLIGEECTTNTDTHRLRNDLISLLLFFRKKGSRLNL
jgi:hypothetical protein